MSPLVLSFVLMILGAAGLMLLALGGRLAPWGWAAQLLAEPIWVLFALKTHAYGLVPSSVLFAGVQIFGYNRSRSVKKGTS